MKIYILTNTDWENEIVGAFSSEALANEYSVKYCTPEIGEMTEENRYELSMMKVTEYTLDDKL